MDNPTSAGEMTATSYRNSDGGVTLAVTFQESMERHFVNAVFDRAAMLIAERYVAENYQAIVAMLDQNAIATLSVAEAGAAIRKTLHERLPERVREVVKKEREVYQRVVFGGLRRIL